MEVGSTGDRERDAERPREKALQNQLLQCRYLSFHFAHTLAFVARRPLRMTLDSSFRCVFTASLQSSSFSASLLAFFPLTLFLLIAVDDFFAVVPCVPNTADRLAHAFNKHSKRCTSLFCWCSHEEHRYAHSVACMKLSCFDLLPGCANNNNHKMNQATWNKTLLTHSLTCIDRHTNTDERNEIEKLCNRCGSYAEINLHRPRQEPRGTRERKISRNEKNKQHTSNNSSGNSSADEELRQRVLSCIRNESLTVGKSTKSKAQVRWQASTKEHTNDWRNEKRSAHRSRVGVLLPSPSLPLQNMEMLLLWSYTRKILNWHVLSE